MTYAREIRIPVRACPYSAEPGIVLINTPVNSRRVYVELIRLVREQYVTIDVASAARDRSHADVALCKHRGPTGAVDCKNGMPAGPCARNTPEILKRVLEYSAAPTDSVDELQEQKPLHPVN